MPRLMQGGNRIAHLPATEVDHVGIAADKRVAVIGSGWRIEQYHFCIRQARIHEVAERLETLAAETNDLEDTEGFASQIRSGFQQIAGDVAQGVLVIQEQSARCPTEIDHGCRRCGCFQSIAKAFAGFEPELSRDRFEPPLNGGCIGLSVINKAGNVDAIAEEDDPTIYKCIPDELLARA